jgi:hypothetical protein
VATAVEKRLQEERRDGAKTGDGASAVEEEKMDVECTGDATMAEPTADEQVDA